MNNVASQGQIPSSLEHKGRATKAAADQSAKRRTGAEIRTRQSAPRQQFTTLKVALTAGTIAATLWGAQLLAANDSTTARAQTATAATASTATQLTTPQRFAARPSNAQLGTELQPFSNNQPLQSPTLRTLPRQSFRPLTRSRSSR
ncbi:MAG: hypothetical protein KDE19_15760 [Caldilineaceae bacterium]|nr:hypothetical protein [Caldilineaceae bacterium]